MILEKLDGTYLPVKPTDIRDIKVEELDGKPITLIMTPLGSYLVKESKEVILEKIKSSPRQLLCD